MDKIQLEQQIDRFINNEMSASEHQEFRQRLEMDKDLKKQVELRMILIEGELIHAEEKARAAMEASRHSGIHSRHSGKTFRRSWLAAACVVLILLGIGYAGHTYRYSTQEIYQTYYAIPIIERTRGEGMPEQVAIYNQQIINNFEQHKYKEISELYQSGHLSEIIGQFPASTLLYISIALLEQQKASEAISLLQPLVTTPYQEEAEWLLLCCYLSEGDRNSALQLVEKIANANGLYVDKAILIKTLLQERRWF